MIAEQPHALGLRTYPKKVEEMKTLPIIWQRLVDEKGETCERCHSTYKEIQKAFKKLKQALHPLAIDVIFNQNEIAQSAFVNDPSQSNRIWIGSKSLEEWLEAKVGQSQCCDICEGSECRTIETDTRVYEVIPEELIIKAGLLAASYLFGDNSDLKVDSQNNYSKAQQNSCCSCSDISSDKCC